MKPIVIYITNNATAYGGVQPLRQIVLFVWLGNPIVYKGNTFTWEQGRKLAGIDNTIRYSYDGNGMRYKKVVNGNTTEYYYNGTQLLAEYRKGTDELLAYFYDQSGVAGLIYDSRFGGIRYYYFDKNTLGDIIAIRDEGGNVVAEYFYDAWGNILHEEGGMASVNPFRYRGYYYDTETGFYYLQTRYYDPTICRFINADDYGLVSQLASSKELNMYAYCANNPIMYTDETGNFAITTFGIAAMIAITLGSALIGGAAQLASNVLAEQTGSELWRGVAGATVGTGVNALMLCLTMSTGGASLFIAAGSSAIVQTGVDALETLIRKEEVGWEVLLDLGLNFGTTLIGNYIGAKIVPINVGWFKPQKFLSVFTNAYGKKLLAQTAIGATLASGINFIRKYDWSQYNINWKIPVITVPVMR